MPAHLINTSNRLNANTAGQTRTGADANAGSAPVATTVSEAAAALNPANALDSLFAGGVHPETVPTVTPAPLEKATNSIRGVLGGLKPAPGSNLTPGPTGGAAAAKTVQAGTERIQEVSTSALSRVRRLFNPKAAMYPPNVNPGGVERPA